jgi:hypothetical protein
VLQFSERTENPYQDEERGLAINADTVPAKGTKVQLIFTPHQEKAQQAAAPAKENPPAGEAKP